ncbi:MAG: hypothetical protein RMI56_03060 [Sulfolobales archaeon]|nr:hypothetical protein [Sulfolobales archaeon]MDW8082760.1 hypothetical protein [Sulfolobales archaeon]
MTQSAATSKSGRRELLFIAIVVVVWTAAFGVYFVNSPSPSLWSLSSAYAYSLMWWLVATLVFIAYTIYDLAGGG